MEAHQLGTSIDPLSSSPPINPTFPLWEEAKLRPNRGSQHHLHFPWTEKEYAALVSVSPSFMSGMPKYPFRMRKTQCSPWDLRSDTSRETGERRRRQPAADLVFLKLSYELFQQNGFHLLCEIANLDCKIHCAHPTRCLERGCKYCYATTRLDEGEK